MDSADAATFDLDSANAVTAANYTSVTPTGANISQTLAAGAKTDKGNAIVNGMPYNVFVLSVADGVNALTNALSASSSVITLQAALPVAAGAISNLAVVDTADNGNGSDLHISFDKVLDETKVSGYRIIVVDSVDASTFDLDSANAVIAANYTAVTPTGANISQTLAAGATTNKGNSIVNNMPYNVFVLSVADGVNAITNALSASSSTITLKTAIGIEDIVKAQNNIEIYNIDNTIYINFLQNESRKGVISVYNVNGQLLKQLNTSKLQNKITLTGKQEGILFIRVETANIAITKKFLLAR